jgi:hypothetical protein
MFFAAGVYLAEAQNPTHICSILIDTGKWGKG